MLTCLRDLLELTEYMFKGTAKTNPYKLDVYLLIGESLVRQGQIPQAIGIYRCILSEDKEYKSSIYLNMSWRLREDHSADPHVLIEFLQELAGSIEI